LFVNVPPDFLKGFTEGLKNTIMFSLGGHVNDEAKMKQVLTVVDDFFMVRKASGVDIVFLNLFLRVCFDNTVPCLF
jgi:hypothetical protein